VQGAKRKVFVDFVLQLNFLLCTLNFALKITKNIMSDYLLLENVTKRFQSPEGKDVTAVDSANLDIAKGEFVTLLGPSGCGKTTTLRMIAGFEFPTEGRIVLEGKDIAMLPPNKREMAMVFQSYALFPHLSVYENIAYGLRLRKMSGATLDKTVQDAMDVVNLKGMGKRRPAQLSGGQQQRVALARALAIKPKVLLFDEPLSNLDAKLRVSLRVEIRQLQKRLGITSIYVTHDQSEAMSLSDRIVVMSAGKIMQVAEPREIYLHPNNPFVADFIGQANFLDGVANSVNGEMAEVNVQGQVVNVPCQVALSRGRASWLCGQRQSNWEQKAHLPGASKRCRTWAARWSMPLKAWGKSSTWWITMRPGSACLTKKTMCAGPSARIVLTR